MTDSKKIETLEKAILSLDEYKKDLTNDNVSCFEKLKSKILDMLTENERFRFSQIEFYSEQDDYDDIMSDDDDLPF